MTRYALTRGRWHRISSWPTRLKRCRSMWLGGCGFLLGYNKYMMSEHYMQQVGLAVATAIIGVLVGMYAESLFLHAPFSFTPVTLPSAAAGTIVGRDGQALVLTNGVGTTTVMLTPH